MGASPSTPACADSIKKILDSKECLSRDEYLGNHDSLEECACACGEQNGCKYFIYGKNMWWTLFPDKSGECYWEKSQPKQHYDNRNGKYGEVYHCPEGYEHDAYDFYIHDQHATVKVGLSHRVYSRGADTSAYHRQGSIDIIIPVVIAAVLLVAAVLYLVRKRRIAAATPDEVPQLDTEEPIETEAS